MEQIFAQLEHTMQAPKGRRRQIKDDPSKWCKIFTKQHKVCQYGDYNFYTQKFSWS